MTWQTQKKILLAVSVILIALLSFAIGVSFGTSYNKESLIDVLFPALGVVGNWIAGIGAIAAVFTSLWLADNQRKLNTEEIEVLENFGSKLEFTHLDDETWTFSIDGDRLKLEFETLNNVKKVIYFSKTKENFNDLNICPEGRSKGVFDWKFLK